MTPTGGLQPPQPATPQPHSLGGEQVLGLDPARQEGQAAGQLDGADVAGARVAAQRHHHRLQAAGTAAPWGNLALWVSVPS